MLRETSQISAMTAIARRMLFGFEFQLAAVATVAARTTFHASGHQVNSLGWGEVAPSRGVRRGSRLTAAGLQPR